MMKHLAFKTFLVLLASLLAFGEEKFDYSGYQVIRIEIRDEQDVADILTLEKDNSLCDGCTFEIWSKYGPGVLDVDVMASPKSLSALQSWIETNGLKWSVIIQDLASFFKEMEPIKITRRRNMEHSMDWDSYHRLEDIHGWFDYLERKFDFCQTEIIGKTFEKREMKVMKVRFD